MAIAFKSTSNQLTASLVTQFTAPAIDTVIIGATATNVTGTTRTVTVHVVKSGGSADSTNITIEAASVTLNKEIILDGLVGHVLQQGDFVSAVAEAATAVNLLLSFRERS